MVNVVNGESFLNDKASKIFTSTYSAKVLSDPVCLPLNSSLSYSLLSSDTNEKQKPNPETRGRAIASFCNAPLGALVLLTFIFYLNSAQG